MLILPDWAGMALLASVVAMVLVTLWYGHEFKMACRKNERTAAERKLAGTLDRLMGTVKNRLKEELRVTGLKVLKVGNNISIVHGAEQIFYISPSLVEGQIAGEQIRLLISDSAGMFMSYDVSSEEALDKFVHDARTRITRYHKTHCVA